MELIRTCPLYDTATHEPINRFVERADGEGIPYLEQVVVTKEEAAAERMRGERDAAMPEPLNILSRHRNQRDFGLPTTLTDEQAVAWAVYLQGLRDYPETGMWPDKPE